MDGLATQQLNEQINPMYDLSPVILGTSTG